MSSIFSPSHEKRSKGEKVVGIDIDDVLADSIPQWIEYANTKIKEIHLIEDSQYIFSKEWMFIRYEDLYQLKKNVPYYYYRLLKSLYRRSETKKNLPLKPFVVETMERLKQKGYKIIIITKRDESCSLLTYDWLHKNGIQYDEVVFSQQKHIKILERFPEMKFMIEDNLDIANIVAKWGYDVFLINNRYNFGECHDRVERIDTIDQIFDYVY